MGIDHIAYELRQVYVYKRVLDRIFMLDVKSSQARKVPGIQGILVFYHASFADLRKGELHYGQVIADLIGKDILLLHRGLYDCPIHHIIGICIQSLYRFGRITVRHIRNLDVPQIKRFLTEYLYTNIDIVTE